MYEERRLKHVRTITISHSLINRMTHRLSTLDAGTPPVYQMSYYVQKIYSVSQCEKSEFSSEEVTTDQHTFFIRKIYSTGNLKNIYIYIYMNIYFTHTHKKIT